MIERSHSPHKSTLVVPRSFHDTTSLYFEGEGSASLGTLEHIKDSRPDLHQMVVGAVLNDQGEPICFEIWPGNTADISSIIPVVDRMKTRFGISSVRMRKQKIVNEQVLSRGGRYKEVRSEKEPTENEPLKVKEVWADDKRFIVCCNDR